jgi:hypothetical protein
VKNRSSENDLTQMDGSADWKTSSGRRAGSSSTRLSIFRWPTIPSAITAAQLALTTYVVAGGWLYQDDIRAIIFISGQSFWDSLLWTNGTHVVPGTHAVLWAHGDWFGLVYWPAAILIILLRTVATWSVWRMLEAVLGRTSASFLALTFYAFSPMAITATAWYAQALTILPIHIALAWSVIWMAKYKERGRRIDAVLCAACVAGGLAFAEKAIVLLVFLPVVYLLVLERVTTFADACHAVLKSSLLWALLATVGASWTLLYTSNDGMDGEPLEFSKLAYMALHHSGYGLLPTLFGGPWIWWRTDGRFYDDSPYFSIADPPSTIVGLLGVILIVGFVIYRKRHRRTGKNAEAVRAVVVAASYYLPCFLLVALARGYMLWDQLGVDLRFWADAVPATALALGLHLGRSDIRRTLGRRPGIVLLSVWLLGSILSTAGFAAAWHRNNLDAFISRATKQTVDVGPNSGFYETELPARVISHQFGAENGTGFLITWVSPDASIGESQPHMKVLDRGRQER